jgi:hypothetical protein
MSPLLEMAVTVGVYEKNGLKRGAGLTDVGFTAFPGWQPGEKINVVSGGGPFGSPVYLLDIEAFAPANSLLPGVTHYFHLGVNAPKHYPQNFFSARRRQPRGTPRSNALTPSSGLASRLEEPSDHRGLGPLGLS